MEGQSVIVEYRAGDGHIDRFAALAANLVRLNPDRIPMAVAPEFAQLGEGPRSPKSSPLCSEAGRRLLGLEATHGGPPDSGQGKPSIRSYLS